MFNSCLQTSQQAPKLEPYAVKQEALIFPRGFRHPDQSPHRFWRRRSVVLPSSHWERTAVWPCFLEVVRLFKLFDRVYPGTFAKIAFGRRISGRRLGCRSCQSYIARELGGQVWVGRSHNSFHVLFQYPYTTLDSPIFSPKHPILPYPNITLCYPNTIYPTPLPPYTHTPFRI